MLHRIKHMAIVDTLLPEGRVIVRLSDGAKADCTGCRIASLCSRSADYTMEVDSGGQRELKKGDRVEIIAPEALSRRAVALLLILPLVILISAVAVAIAVGCTESAAVIIGLLSLAATFLILIILRRHIESPAQWSISGIYS